MSFADLYTHAQSEKKIKRIISEDNLKLDQGIPRLKTTRPFYDSDSERNHAGGVEGHFDGSSEADKSHYRNCLRHKEEKLSMMCSDLYCPFKGPVCSVCLLEEHSDHLEKTGDLDFYLRQISAYLKQHKIGQSKQEDINDILIDFKFLIDQQKKKITLLLEQIDVQAKSFISQIKESSEKDISEIVHVITRIQDDQNKMTTSNYQKEIGDLTQYFEFYPQTKQIFRKEVMRELFLNKIQHLINEKTDIVYQNIHSIYKSLYKILDTLNDISIQKHKIQDFHKLNLEAIEKQQRIKTAHLNWIRNVITFEMTEYEVEKLGIKNELIDNVCIVSCSDDMTIKFWVNKTGEGPFNFKLLREISQAHDKEIFVMRILEMNSVTRMKLSQSCSDCSNILMTGQNGKVKIWNWIQGKCVNEIQTRSQFLNDFIVLENPQQRLVCNSGGKNMIVLFDWAIFDGLKIMSIHPKEDGRELVSLCRIERKVSQNSMINQIKRKIDAFHKQILEESKQGVKRQQNQIQEDKSIVNDDANGDLFAASFASNDGVVKVFNQKGDCLNTIYRKEPEWNVCLETMKVLKYYPKISFGDATYALVSGADSSTLAVFTNKEVFRKEKAHEGMIRGLCVWEVRDGLNLRNIIITAGDLDNQIKMWEGVDGSLLRSISGSQSGLRWRSLTLYQAKKLEKEGPIKQQDQHYLIFGSKHGTIYVYGISR